MDNEGNPKMRDDWTEDDVKNAQTNACVINILYCAGNGTKYDKISCYDNAKEMWDKL